MNIIDGKQTYATRQRPEKYTDVIYAAPHLRDGNGDGHEWDWERGMVASTNDRFIFVKFYSSLSCNGWNDAESRACRPEDLIPA